jgi:hypothetical protein
MNIIKLFIAISFISSICLSQTNIADILYPRSADTLIYSDLPTYTIDELSVIQNSIVESPEKITEGCVFDKSYFLDTSKTQYFKKIDLNGDGQMDIIYTSNHCADELIQLVWIKYNNDYKFLRRCVGSICRLFRNQNKKFSLLIRTGYCCGGYVAHYKLYNPFFKDKNELFAGQEIKICEFYDTQFPQEKISPRHFTTLTDKVPLRLSHNYNNSLDSLRSQAEGRTVYGNIIAEYAERSTGKLLGEYLDNNGEHWYFVLMDNKNFVGYDRFYEDYKTFKCGWVNSKDIKIQ